MPTEERSMIVDPDDPENQIHAAAKALEIPDIELRRCAPIEESNIVREGMQRFVNGSPRSWWLSLKRKGKRVSVDHGFLHLAELIPPRDSLCWLIPETDREHLPVFELHKKWLIPIFSECSFFEYYVMSLRYDWLIIENDHNELIVVDE
jgi:hypothetical protein